MLCFADNAAAEWDDFVYIQRSAKCSINVDVQPAINTGNGYQTVNLANITYVINELEKQGITKEELKEGVQCFSGDFNGDKITDYAFLSKFEVPSGIKNYPHERWIVSIVFMHGYEKKPIVTLIPETFYNTPDLYPSKHKKNDKDVLSNFECPTDNIMDGVVEWGEGGATNIFFWDKKKSDFVMESCRSENG